MNIKTIATGSAGNCYLISDGHTKILIECGIPFKTIQKALNFETYDIDGCLISHSHGDHCAGIRGVLAASINCYAAKETIAEIGIEHHRLKPVQASKQFKIGTFTILPFEGQHDVYTLGFLIQSTNGEKLLFITDSYYCKYRFKGITQMMVECNYSLDILDANIESGRTPKMMRRRLLQSHMSIENLKEFLQANDLSKLKEIHLLHLSDTNSDEDRFRREIGELTGKMIYIP